MASLKRIAADLGVSYSLVSKVLSGRLGTTRVSEETREAILKKVKELDYAPNRLAVALKAGRKGAVGIFLHHLGSPGSDLSDLLLQGMAEGLERQDILMWLRFFKTDEEFQAACDANLKRSVDGLIVAGVSHPRLFPRFRELESSGVPIITVFSDVKEALEAGNTNVVVDYELQGYLPVQHLLELGCRRIALLDTLDLRTNGYMRAHKDAGVKVDPALLIPARDFSKECGAECTEQILRSKLEIDAICCQSDSQASAVVNTLILNGVRVPEDVRVTGMDNSPVAENCIVPITSTSSETYEVGRLAVEMLLERISGNPVQSRTLVPELELRASTGGAADKRVPAKAEPKAKAKAAR